MVKRKSKDPKQDALKKRGTLNPRPEDVTDELFRDKEFFDSRDLVQVKYEMVRRVRADGHRVAHAARSFGLSRPSFYLASEAFEQGGLPGLLPAKRGPRRAHKLSAEVMEFVAHKLEQDPALKARDLAGLIKDELHIRVHPRSIERALKRAEKKTP